MASSNTLRVRRSIRAMQVEYESGNKKPMEDLMRAWIGIKELAPSDPRSFFSLGGFHGEPFQYRKAVDQLDATDKYSYWGGFCNHGNVLFPTWHRVYVLKVEDALRSIVPGVTLPYWDETDDYSMQSGIPTILTQETFELDGKTIKNPLRSFVLPKELTDKTNTVRHAYQKPEGYETVRYPLSGLVGTAESRKETEEHNSRYPDPIENASLLNKNVMAWLHGAGDKNLGPTPSNPDPVGDGVYAQYMECLSAPNYTVFSNTTSAAQWNAINPGKVTPLERPHNDIHLGVGGFDMPGERQRGQIRGANGDMGENNTAGMDPIFFFHHCNVDRMFWLWQKRHGMKDQLDIIPNFAGTSSSDGGPTPGLAPATTLDMTTALLPFTKDDGTMFTSNDCVNLETQLKVTYYPGSLDEDFGRTHPLADSLRESSRGKKLHVSGINRTAYQGSFIVVAYATEQQADGTTSKRYLGHESVLSRYDVTRCANCLTHVEVVAHFPLHGVAVDAVQAGGYHVELVHRTGVDILAPHGSGAPHVLAATGAVNPPTAFMQVID
jgi:tyrosinase